MEPIDIDGLRASVAKQGGIVRQLKKDGAPQEEVTAGMDCFPVPYSVLFHSCKDSSGAQEAIGGGSQEAGA